MDKQELAAEILRLKKQKGIKILAHTYQAPEIIEIADITGDSYALSVAAKSIETNTVLMCGVRFMAETVKMLSPEKTVLLSEKNATCPMAEQISPQTIIDYKTAHPDCVVVCYINTTAELKAVCDVCVTSSSAVKIVKQLSCKNILFVPDKNLGSYVEQRVPEKNFTFLNGFCPIHNSISADDVLAAKAEHKNAKLAMHPECPKEAVELADFVGATSGIIKYINSTDDDVIIATERGVYDFIKYKQPNRGVFQLAPEKLVCEDMKMTTLESVYRAIIGTGGCEVKLDEQLRADACKCIDNMLRYGG